MEVIASVAAPATMITPAATPRLVVDASTTNTAASMSIEPKTMKSGLTGLRMLSRAEAKRRVAGRLGVIPIVETAAGVVAVNDIAAAPRVCQLMAGEIDSGAELGIDPGYIRCGFHYGSGWWWPQLPQGLGRRLVPSHLISGIWNGWRRRRVSFTGSGFAVGR